MQGYGIVIVDEHELVRAGVSLILQAQPDFRIAAEAAKAKDAVPLVLKHAPAVVCLGAKFAASGDAEATDGIAVAHEIHEALASQPELRKPAVLLLASSRDAGLPSRAYDAASGVDGVVSKSWEPEALVAAIRAAAEHAQPTS